MNSIGTITQEEFIKEWYSPEFAVILLGSMGITNSNETSKDDYLIISSHLNKALNEMGVEVCLEATISALATALLQAIRTQNKLLREKESTSKMIDETVAKVTVSYQYQ